MQCPLCNNSATRHFHRDKNREYRQCDCCLLVFVPPDYHLDAAREKAEYDLHQNNVDDPGYRRFLSRLVWPVQAKIPPPAQGLDFGCGPGPALAQMFQKAGYVMKMFDKFYARDFSVLAGPYDFITCTEVVEHLAEPGKTLDQLFSIIVPGGWLGIMTKLVIDSAAFARWHYKNDLTHICFFSRYTFQWLANHWACPVEFVGNDVILLKKPT